MQEDPVLYKMGNQDNNKVFSNANKQHVEQACSIWCEQGCICKREWKCGLGGHSREPGGITSGGIY